jgi:multicomponent Na+:H+ antiporter subunit F
VSSWFIIVLWTGMVLLSVSTLLCLERMRRGPTILDRILAFDAIVVMIIGMIITLSVFWKTSLYLDMILVFTLLNFIATVAFAFYLHRTYEPHPEPESSGFKKGVKFLKNKNTRKKV